MAASEAQREQFMATLRALQQVAALQRQLGMPPTTTAVMLRKYSRRSWPSSG